MPTENIIFDNSNGFSCGGTAGFKVFNSADQLILNVEDDGDMRLPFLSEGIVKASADGTLSTNNLTDGQIIIGTTAGIQPANFLAGTGINITHDGTDLTISSTYLGSQTLYFNQNTAGSEATYKELYNISDGGSTSTLNSTPDVLNSYVGGWISQNNLPNVAVIPAGTWFFEIFAQGISNVTGLSFYFNVYKYSVGDVSTLLFSNQSSPTSIISLSQHVYTVPFVVTQTTIDVTDRILITLYANSTNVSRYISFFFDDSTASSVNTTFAPFQNYFNQPLQQVGQDVSLNYSSTNLKLTGNNLDTIQNITTTSTPTFSGLTVNGGLTGNGDVYITRNTIGESVLSLRQVSSNPLSTARFFIQNDTVNKFETTMYSSNYTTSAYQNAVSIRNNAGKLHLAGLNNINDMVIDTNGDIGIGTAVPDSDFELVRNTDTASTICSRQVSSSPNATAQFMLKDFSANTFTITKYNPSYVIVNDRGAVDMRNYNGELRLGSSNAPDNINIGTNGNVIIRNGLTIGTAGNTYMAGVLGYTDSNHGFLYRPPQAGLQNAHLFESFAGNDLMKITESGNVGIGTAPTALLDLQDPLGSVADIYLRNGSNVVEGQIYSGNGSMTIGTYGTLPLYFNTNSTTKLSIASNGDATHSVYDGGNLLIGGYGGSRVVMRSTAGTLELESKAGLTGGTIIDTNGKMTIRQPSGGSSYGLSLNQSGVGGSSFFFNGSGSYTVLKDDGGNGIDFQGHTGSSMARLLTNGDTVLGGKLTINNNANNVGSFHADIFQYYQTIGNSAEYYLRRWDTSPIVYIDASNNMTLSGNSMYVRNTSGLLSQHDGSNGFIRSITGSLYLGYGAINNIQLTNAGGLNYTCPASSGNLGLKITGFGSGKGWGITMDSTANDTDGLEYIQFRNSTGGTVLGTIKRNNALGGLEFKNNSDRRLKDDIKSLDDSKCLESITNCLPRSFKWNATDTPSIGFIADEVQQHIPHAITGQPNALYDDGSPNYQSIHALPLIANLVGAVRELKKTINQLTARIAILEH
jgi:hypothetical protein